MKKSLVALLLAVAMLLSIVPAMADISPALPYEGETITYHCVGADLVTEDRESAVWAEFQKMIGNVELNWEVLPMSDFDTKQNVYLNSGEIPDLMWTRGNVAVVATFGDMNYWLDLNDYMDYMPNWEWWMANKSHLQTLYAEDGGLYCIVDVVPNDACNETWFYNKTALDALGYTAPPQTWDEMHEMMLAYKAANPDGLPFLTYAWGLGTYMKYIRMFGGWERDAWYFNEDTGLWDNAIVNPDSGHKDMVAFMNTMYTEGLLHPEFDTIAEDTLNQHITNGNWLFAPFYTTHLESAVFHGYENLTFELGHFITPALTEGAPRYSIVTSPANQLGGFGFFASAEVEKPEIVASLLDFCISQEAADLNSWGIQGVSYDIDETGKKYFLDDYGTNSEKMTELGVGCNHLLRMLHQSTSAVNFEKNNAVTPLGNLALDELCDAFRDGILTDLSETRAKPTFTLEENDTIAVSANPMATYYNENVINFITGERPMDEWDDFVEEYKSMGNVEEVLAIYNAAPQNLLDMSRTFPDYIPD